MKGNRRVHLEKDFAQKGKVQKRVDRNRIVPGERRVKLVSVKKMFEKDSFTKVQNVKWIINRIWVEILQTGL
jgi:hypothetical protein